MLQASPLGVQLSLLTHLLDNITGDASVRDVVNNCEAGVQVGVLVKGVGSCAA